jgi:transcriptional regulator with XRE-family HTH domain
VAYTVRAVGNGPPNRAYKTLQSLLRRARKCARLTQEELSLRLKRPQSFVSKYERGERRLDVIEFAEVAGALGIDPVQFLKKLYREIS